MIIIWADLFDTIDLSPYPVPLQIMFKTKCFSSLMWAKRKTAWTLWLNASLTFVLHIFHLVLGFLTAHKCHKHYILFLHRASVSKLVVLASISNLNISCCYLPDVCLNQCGFFMPLSSIWLPVFPSEVRVFFGRVELAQDEDARSPTDPIV